MIYMKTPQIRVYVCAKAHSGPNPPTVMPPPASFKV